MSEHYRPPGQAPRQIELVGTVTEKGRGVLRDYLQAARQ
jgi:hypothetical protein